MIEALFHSDFYWLYLFIAGLITGIISAMGGSGGLIITPFLIASGVPIHLAIGSAKLSSLGMWAVTLFKFNKADKVQWKYVPYLSIIAIVGGITGSYITINLYKETIYPIVGICLLLISPIALIQKDMGIKTNLYGKIRNIIGYILFLVISIFGGFFGGGSGTFATLVLISFMGMTTLSAYATFIAPWAILTIISSSIFAWHGYIDYTMAAVMFIGMALGGWLGAHLAIKGSDKLVKIFTFSFAFIVGIKLIYDSLLQ